MLELDSERIRVAVRIRPLPAHSTAEPIWQVSSADTDGQESFIRLKDASKKPAFYTVDYCFDHTATNQQVFATSLRPIVQTTFAGLQSTILAYGQTNSGKTYSILGIPNSPGILPLALADLFSNRDALQSHQVQLSYYEIFNEKVRDLIGNRAEVHVPRPFAKETPTLRVKEHHRDGFFVEGLKQVPVTSLDEALLLINDGEQRRQYAQTRWNDYSSRSHVLCTISIVHASTRTMQGKINIVDLAGCENQKLEQSGDGRSINRSLFFLGEVIARLAKQKDRRHSVGTVCSPSSSSVRSQSRSRSVSLERDTIGMLTPSSPSSSCSASPSRRAACRGSSGKCNFIPYRDSTLTRILRTSLGGTALTCVLCTIHPAIEFVDQSMTTLRFAEKARLVENRIRVNLNKSNTQTIDNASMMSSVVENQQFIIAQLRLKLFSLQREQNFHDAGDVQDLQRQLQHKEDLLQEKDSELARLRAALEGKQQQCPKKCGGNDNFRLPRKRRNKVPDTVQRTRGRVAAASRSTTFATKSVSLSLNTTDTNTRSSTTNVTVSSSPSSSRPPPLGTSNGKPSLPPVNSLVAATPPLSPGTTTHYKYALPNNADPVSPNAAFHHKEDSAAWSATLRRAEDVTFESLLSDRFVVRQQGAAPIDVYDDMMMMLHRATVNTTELNAGAAHNTLSAAQQHSNRTPDMVHENNRDVFLITTQNGSAEVPVKLSSRAPTGQFGSSTSLEAELFDSSSVSPIAVQDTGTVEQPGNSGFLTAAQYNCTAGQLCSTTSPVTLHQNRTAEAFGRSAPPIAAQHNITAGQPENSSSSGAYPIAVQRDGIAGQLGTSAPSIAVQHSGTAEPLDTISSAPPIPLPNNDTMGLSDGSAPPITFHHDVTTGEFNISASTPSTLNSSGEKRNGATMIEQLWCLAMMQINQDNDSATPVPVPVLPRPVEYTHHKSSELNDRLNIKRVK